MVDTLLPSPALSLDQQAQLADLEAVIRRGLAAYRDSGAALSTIRKAKLYRATHRSFDAYCRQRWSMTRMHAHRLIHAAEVAEVLERAGLPVPWREKTCRVLAVLPVGQVCEMWRAALERAGGDRQPTAALVEALIAGGQGNRREGQSAPTTPQARALALLVAALKRARQLLAGMRGTSARHVGDVVDRAAELAARLEV